MRNLNELRLHSKFEVQLPKDTSLLSKLVDVGLVPNRTFKKLFQLANGSIIIGDNSLKIALDPTTASNINVNII